MDFKEWPKTLAEALLKNPRAAFSIGAVAVIVAMSGFVLGLIAFIRLQNADRLEDKTTANTELRGDNRDLRKENAILQRANDSLLNLAGEVKADGLRREVALKDSNLKDLAKINRFLQARMEYQDQMARELEQLRKTSKTVRKYTEIVKPQSE